MEQTPLRRGVVADPGCPENQFALLYEISSYDAASSIFCCELRHPANQVVAQAPELRTGKAAGAPSDRGGGRGQGSASHSSQATGCRVLLQIISEQSPASLARLPEQLPGHGTQVSSDNPRDAFDMTSCTALGDELGDTSHDEFGDAGRLPWPARNEDAATSCEGGLSETAISLADYLAELHDGGECAGVGGRCPAWASHLGDGSPFAASYTPSPVRRLPVWDCSLLAHDTSSWQRWSKTTRTGKKDHPCLHKSSQSAHCSTLLPPDEPGLPGEVLSRLQESSSAQQSSRGPHAAALPGGSQHPGTPDARPVPLPIAEGDAPTHAPCPPPHPLWQMLLRLGYVRHCCRLVGHTMDPAAASAGVADAGVEVPPSPSLTESSDRCQHGSRAFCVARDSQAGRAAMSAIIGAARLFHTHGTRPCCVPTAVCVPTGGVSFCCMGGRCCDDHRRASYGCLHSHHIAMGCDVHHIAMGCEGHQIGVGREDCADGLRQEGTVRIHQVLWRSCSKEPSRPGAGSGGVRVPGCGWQHWDGPHPNLMPLFGCLCVAGGASAEGGTNGKRSRSEADGAVRPHQHALVHAYSPFTLQNALHFSPAALGDHTSRLLVLYQIIAALAYCHERGVAHGDLRPSILFLDPEDPWVWVAGFTGKMQGEETWAAGEDCKHIEATNAVQMAATSTSRETQEHGGAVVPLDTEVARPGTRGSMGTSSAKETADHSTWDRWPTSGGITAADVPPPVSGELRRCLQQCHTCVVASLLDLWQRREVGNFDYLTALNYLAGRRWNDPSFHWLMPWVIDMSVAPELLPSGGGPGWRDLSQTKWRLAKGDEQLDVTYASAEVPHHITDEPMSELTLCMYKARRLPVSVLTRVVRAVFQPKEYPASITRLYHWTPDECIPEFYFDPSIFRSLHENMEDLRVPAWATGPDDFVARHRQALESDFVSMNLHKWIDLTFGYQLSGEAAVAAKNVHLAGAPGDHAGRGHGGLVLRARGQRQLFSVPHPPRWPVVPTALAGVPTILAGAQEPSQVSPPPLSDLVSVVGNGQAGETLAVPPFVPGDSSIPVTSGPHTLSSDRPSHLCGDISRRVAAPAKCAAGGLDAATASSNTALHPADGNLSPSAALPSPSAVCSRAWDEHVPRATKEHPGDSYDHLLWQAWVCRFVAASAHLSPQYSDPLMCESANCRARLRGDARSEQRIQRTTCERVSGSGSEFSDGTGAHSQFLGGLPLTQGLRRDGLQGKFEGGAVKPDQAHCSTFAKDAGQDKASQVVAQGKLATLCSRDDLTLDAEAVVAAPRAAASSVTATTPFAAAAAADVFSAGLIAAELFGGVPVLDGATCAALQSAHGMKGRGRKGSGAVGGPGGPGGEATPGGPSGHATAGEVDPKFGRGQGDGEYRGRHVLSQGDGEYCRQVGNQGGMEFTLATVTASGTSPGHESVHMERAKLSAVCEPSRSRRLVVGDDAGDCGSALPAPLEAACNADGCPSGGMPKGGPARNAPGCFPLNGVDFPIALLLQNASGIFGAQEPGAALGAARQSMIDGQGGTAEGGMASEDPVPPGASSRDDDGHVWLTSDGRVRQRVDLHRGACGMAGKGLEEGGEEGEGDISCGFKAAEAKDDTHGCLDDLLSSMVRVPLAKLDPLPVDVRAMVLAATCPDSARRATMAKLQHSSLFPPEVRQAHALLSALHAVPLCARLGELLRWFRDGRLQELSHAALALCARTLCRCLVTGARSDGFSSSAAPAFLAGREEGDSTAGYSTAMAASRDVGSGADSLPQATGAIAVHLGSNTMGVPGRTAQASLGAGAGASGGLDEGGNANGGVRKTDGRVKDGKPPRQQVTVASLAAFLAASLGRQLTLEHLVPALATLLQSAPSVAPGIPCPRLQGQLRATLGLDAFLSTWHDAVLRIACASSVEPLMRQAVIACLVAGARELPLPVTLHQTILPLLQRMGNSCPGAIAAAIAAIGEELGPEALERHVLPSLYDIILTADNEGASQRARGTGSLFRDTENLRKSPPRTTRGTDTSHADTGASSPGTTRAGGREAAAALSRASSTPSTLATSPMSSTLIREALASISAVLAQLPRSAVIRHLLPLDDARPNLYLQLLLKPHPSFGVLQEAADGLLQACRCAGPAFTRQHILPVLDSFFNTTQTDAYPFAERPSTSFATAGEASDLGLLSTSVEGHPLAAVAGTISPASDRVQGSLSVLDTGQCDGFQRLVHILYPGIARQVGVEPLRAGVRNAAMVEHLLFAFFQWEPVETCTCNEGDDPKPAIDGALSSPCPAHGPLDDPDDLSSSLLLASASAHAMEGLLLNGSGWSLPSLSASQQRHALSQAPRLPRIAHPDKSAPQSSRHAPRAAPPLAPHASAPIPIVDVRAMATRGSSADGVLTSGMVTPDQSLDTRAAASGHQDGGVAGQRRTRIDHVNSGALAGNRRLSSPHEAPTVFDSRSRMEAGPQASQPTGPSHAPHASASHCTQVPRNQAGRYEFLPPLAEIVAASRHATAGADRPWDPHGLQGTRARDRCPNGIVLVPGDVFRDTSPLRTSSLLASLSQSVGPLFQPSSFPSGGAGEGGWMQHQLSASAAQMPAALSNLINKFTGPASFSGSGGQAGGRTQQGVGRQQSVTVGRTKVGFEVPTEHRSSPPEATSTTLGGGVFLEGWVTSSNSPDRRRPASLPGSLDSQFPVFQRRPSGDAPTAAAGMSTAVAAMVATASSVLLSGTSSANQGPSAIMRVPANPPVGGREALRVSWPPPGIPPNGGGTITLPGGNTGDVWGGEAQSLPSTGSGMVGRAAAFLGGIMPPLPASGASGAMPAAEPVLCRSGDGFEATNREAEGRETAGWVPGEAATATPSVRADGGADDGFIPRGAEDLSAPVRTRWRKQARRWVDGGASTWGGEDDSRDGDRADGALPLPWVFEARELARWRAHGRLLAMHVLSCQDERIAVTAGWGWGGPSRSDGGKGTVGHEGLLSLRLWDLGAAGDSTTDAPLAECDWATLVASARDPSGNGGPSFASRASGTLTPGAGQLAGLRMLAADGSVVAACQGTRLVLCNPYQPSHGLLANYQEPMSGSAGSQWQVQHGRHDAWMAGSASWQRAGDPGASSLPSGSYTSGGGSASGSSTYSARSEHASVRSHASRASPDANAGTGVQPHEDFGLSDPPVSATDGGLMSDEEDEEERAVTDPWQWPQPTTRKASCESQRDASVGAHHRSSRGGRRDPFVALKHVTSSGVDGSGGLGTQGSIPAGRPSRGIPIPPQGGRRACAREQAVNPQEASGLWSSASRGRSSSLADVRAAGSVDKGGGPHRRGGGLGSYLGAGSMASYGGSGHVGACPANVWVGGTQPMAAACTPLPLGGPIRSPASGGVGGLASRADGPCFTCMEVCSSGNTLALGRSDGCVRLYDLLAQQPLASLRCFPDSATPFGPPSVLHTLSFSGVSPRLGSITHHSGGGLTSAMVTEAAGVGPHEPERVCCLSARPLSALSQSCIQGEAVMVAGGAAGTCSLLDGRCGMVAATWRAHGDAVTQVDIPPGWPYCALSSSMDRTMAQWDLRMINRRRPAPLQCWVAHSAGVRGFAMFNGDGVAYAGKHVSMFSLRTLAPEPYSTDAGTLASVDHMMLRSSRLQHPKGLKKLGTIASLSILPYSRLMLVGMEEGQMAVYS
eukprot:jgi/Mesvir1/19645/Mv09928-RA.1